MILPLEEVDNFLNTNEMYETIQKRLNEDGKVLHSIDGTYLEVVAVHDADLDIRWTILNNKAVVQEDVHTEKLEDVLTALVRVV